MAPKPFTASWLSATIAISTLVLAVPARAATPAQEDAERVADLVVANRIIARSRAPALVSADDIMKWLSQSRQSYLIV
jgi:hypothetical protein